MKTVVERYHGLGNDYLVFDPNKNDLKLNRENAAMLCNRNLGLGSDGILEGPFIGEKHMSLKIWNPDGSIAEKSGNGVRIFAKYLKDAGYVQKKKYHLQTDGGMVEIAYLNEDGSRLRISMGKLSFWSDEIPVAGERREVINEDMVFGNMFYPATCVSVGNPHCVIPMDEISEGAQAGKCFRNGKIFSGTREYGDHEGDRQFQHCHRDIRARRRVYHGKRNRSLCGGRRGI